MHHLRGGVLRFGFATAIDRQRLQTVIRRGFRSELFLQLAALAELVEDADDKLQFLKSWSMEIMF